MPLPLPPIPRPYFLTSFFFFFLLTLYFPASGQAVVTGVDPSPPRFLPSIFIAHRVQQSHCSSNFHRVLLTHALALSASQFLHKKKSQRIYSSMHSAGLELTKLTYTRLEDNLIRHRGDRLTSNPRWASRRVLNLPNLRSNETHPVVPFPSCEDGGAAVVLLSSLAQPSL